MSQVHDPTTLNRQGNDIGTSYRSAIFYLSDAQKQTAEGTIADVNASGLWPGKVVTEVTAAGPFWEAEPEHQDYLEKYPNGYTCHFVRPALGSHRYRHGNRSDGSQRRRMSRPDGGRFCWTWRGVRFGPLRGDWRPPPRYEWREQVIPTRLRPRGQ
jgi:Peptide methionine sulfoxide reductase